VEARTDRFGNRRYFPARLDLGREPDGGGSQLSRFDEVIFGTIAFLIISPWTLGNRETLSTIGQMAKVSDDR